MVTFKVTADINGSLDTNFRPGNIFQLQLVSFQYSGNLKICNEIAPVYLTVFGRGVFSLEFHPLLPGEQIVLWAKLNLVKFLCLYNVWALTEIFIQRKFCAKCIYYYINK